MNPNYFQIAATKTTEPQAIELLMELKQLAQELSASEMKFPERINANKARRSEKPTKLSRSDAALLKNLEQDMIDLEHQLCEDFSKMDTLSEIIWSLYNGFTEDINNSNKMLKHYHPDDLPLGEEMIGLKLKLNDTMASFLKLYPNET
ncbi:MAG: hypothetical protein HQK77_19060 [Desulfobacterales bacterium]|nr:hypothetical protein [Desulfobacterales bacterium]